MPGPPPPFLARVQKTLENPLVLRSDCGRVAKSMRFCLVFKEQNLATGGQVTLPSVNFVVIAARCECVSPRPPFEESLGVHPITPDSDPVGEANQSQLEEIRSEWTRIQAGPRGFPVVANSTYQRRVRTDKISPDSGRSSAR